MTSLCDGLNEQQRAAVQATAGPVLIVAGAGSGKTRTLTHRLAFLAGPGGVAPERLLAITFTARAAAEMRARVEALGGRQQNHAGMWIGTVHALGHELLQRHGTRIGLPAALRLIAPADRNSLIRQVLAGLPRGSAIPVGVAAAGRSISAEKNTLGTPQDWSVLTRAYQQALEGAGLVDFDDLITRAVELLDVCPDVREQVQGRFDYVSVDEYQDINPAQYLLLRAIIAPPHNLCAVGDADQAIYAFRGARMEIFMEFQRDFTGARTLRLERTYRSTATVVQAAEALIACNTCRMPKTLTAVRGPGPGIEVCTLADEQAEAGWIAREIERILGGTRLEHSGQAEEWAGGFGDIAVLCRMHHQGRTIGRALQQRGIPWSLHAGSSLFEEPQVQAVIDVLEILVAPQNDFACEQLLLESPCAPGPAALERLRTRARERAQPLWQLIRQGDLPPGLSARARSRLDFLCRVVGTAGACSCSEHLEDLVCRLWQDLHAGDPLLSEAALDLLTACRPFSGGPASGSIRAFLEKTAMAKEGEHDPIPVESVRVMTVHAAKGLEFPVVFMPGLEEGLFPCCSGNGDGVTDLEEERRLFYVGMTRACEKLYLCRARTRSFHGRRGPTVPSPFLGELPASCLHQREIQPRRRKPAQAQKQMKLFDL